MRSARKVAETAGDKENLATAYAYEGDIAHSMGNNKRAYRAYDKALQIDPDHSSVLNNYAYFLSEEHRSLKKALKMSRRAVELEPDNATYLDTLGWILYLLHKPEEAKPYFKHAMIYGGKDSAVVLEHYSKVLKALGEDTLASYYESLAEQKSNNHELALPHFPDFLLCAGSVHVYAQNTSAQESRKAVLEKEIAQLQKQIKDNSTKSANALGELTLIRKQLSNRRELISDSEREIRVLTDSIARVRKEISTIEARLDTMDLYYRRLIKGAYRNRDKRIWYAHLLTSANFAQASRRYSYLKNLSSQMNEEAARITATKAELDEKEAKLNKMKANAEALKAARQKELNQLKKDEKRSDTLIATLKKTRINTRNNWPPSKNRSRP